MPEAKNNVINLGDIKEPLLIFGGAYSNFQATQAVKSIADKNNIPAERCICTGDIVAYCGQPSETIALIREWGVHCLLGNCEESFAANSDDCGCGFDNGSQCDLLSDQWFSFANSTLNKDDRQWFSSLARHIRFSINGLSALVVHGSVSSINQFIFPSCEDEIFKKEFTKSETDLIIGGHCGIPFSKKVDNKIWHNSGAIGMPANDGTTFTWYSIISPYKNSITIEHKKLTYNHQQAAKEMNVNGLKNGYSECLLNGRWPSTDVLPQKEKFSSGKPIAELTYTR